MKMNVKMARVIFISSFLNLISITSHAQVIYGLEDVGHFYSKHSGPFTIQVGTFHIQQHAIHLKEKLTQQLSYPVHINNEPPYYVVTIGPIPTAPAVRQVAASVDDFAIGYLSHQVSTTENKVSSVVSSRSSLQSAVSVKAELPAVQKSHQTFSHQISSTEKRYKNSQNHWLASVNYGLQWLDMPSSMTVPNGSSFSPPYNVDTFSTNANGAQSMLALMLGYEWQRDQKWLPRYWLALRYQYLFSKAISGYITQYTLPQFQNYTYRWNVSANVFSLYSKFDIMQYQRFLPYVDIGLGFAINHASNYSETALPNVTPRISPAYASSSKTQFAYNVGAGLDFQLNAQWLLSLGYDFQAIGKLSSGAGQSTWSSTQLSLGSLKSNTLLLGATYLFDGKEPDQILPSGEGK